MWDYRYQLYIFWYSLEARGGYRYVLTLTDDLSRYGYVYLMKHKSETFEKFKEFQSEVENQRDSGVVSTDFDGALFKVNAAVSKA